MSKTKTLHLPVRHPARCRCPDCPVNKVNRPLRDWIYQLDEEDRMEVAFTLFMKIDEEVRLSASVSQAVSTSLNRIDEGYEYIESRMVKLNGELKQKTDKIVEDYAAQLEKKTGKSREEIEALIKKRVEELQATIKKAAETNQKDSKKFLEDLVERKVEELKKRVGELIEQGKSIDEVRDALTKNTNEQIEKMKKELVEGFVGVLKELGFPKTEQVEALQQALPLIQGQLDKLLSRLTIPSEKGEWGESELYDQLKEFFTEDDIQRIGGPGQPDIVAKPKYNGLQLSREILIESKTEKSWKDDYIVEVRRHMKARKAEYGILAVEKLPRGARECMPNESSDGLILVASREASIPAYAAIRTLLGIEYTTSLQEQSLRQVLKDAKLLQTIEEAREYQGLFKKIRKNAKNITDDIDEADKLLKNKLDDIERRIQSISKEIPQVTE